MGLPLSSNHFFIWNIWKISRLSIDIYSVEKRALVWPFNRIIHLNRRRPSSSTRFTPLSLDALFFFNRLNTIKTPLIGFVSPIQFNSKKKNTDISYRMCEEPIEQSNNELPQQQQKYYESKSTTTLHFVFHSAFISAQTMALCRGCTVLAFHQQNVPSRKYAVWFIRDAIETEATYFRPCVLLTRLHSLVIQTNKQKTEKCELLKLKRKSGLQTILCAIVLS